MESEILTEFRRQCRSASMHYADHILFESINEAVDSAREWGLADKARDAALLIFDDHPDYEAEMREAAAGELWSLSRARPLKIE